MTFGRNIQNTLEQNLHASVFVYVSFLTTLSTFKPDTENNTKFEDYTSHCRPNVM